MLFLVLLAYLRRLNEVVLEVALQVEVRDRVLVRALEELGQNRIRDDATLVRRVKAVVALDVRRNELRHIRLRAEGVVRKSHEGAQLRGQETRLEERVVGTAGLPRLLLLRRHVLGLLGTLTLLRVLDLTASGLHRRHRLLRDLLDLRVELRLSILQLLDNGRETLLGREGRLLRSINNRRNRRHRRLNLRGRGSGLHDLGLRGLLLSDRCNNRGGDDNGGGDRLDLLDRLLGLIGGHRVCY